jgi:hypothetical protein
LPRRFGLDSAAELWFHEVSQALRQRPRMRLQGKLMQDQQRSRDFQKPVQLVKGSGGLACALFAAILACAFWAGAVFASHPLVH